jgi:hypothetical protein
MVTFLSSSASSLPNPVEVELRGILTHAWDLATVETLLNDFCWITDIHPDLENQREVFKVAAWSSCSEFIPNETVLEIVEPTMLEGESLRRTLSYDIKVRVISFDLHPTQSGPPPPSTDDDQGRQKWCRRRRPWKGPPPGLASEAGETLAGGSMRLPVLARLGPQVDSHLEEARLSMTRALVRQPEDILPEVFSAAEGSPISTLQALWGPQDLSHLLEESGSKKIVPAMFLEKPRHNCSEEITSSPSTVGAGPEEAQV